MIHIRGDAICEACSDLIANGDLVYARQTRGTRMRYRHARHGPFGAVVNGRWLRDMRKRRTDAAPK